MKIEGACHPVISVCPFKNENKNKTKIKSQNFPTEAHV